ncbi:hypothetical protein HMPREF1861_01396 [Corynebacterium kroppenstedtii]|nr:hypothetical protein HMPREF1861_01396 [Corynebacterium kroppenstedtii]
MWREPRSRRSIHDDLGSVQDQLIQFVQRKIGSEAEDPQRN